MPNRLSTETSPYLLQHADNPVDWYPWGTEALRAAAQADKPILLSIGYAACHWCHVMAHESFENAETASLMNDLFVNIKVDREERPDLDSIYMRAVQAMTGQGGWPMTVFLTPDGTPFYGGTYFPPSDRHGLPAFKRILESVAAAYREQRGRVAETAAAISRLYSGGEFGAAAPGDAQIHAPDQRLLDQAYRALSQQYDTTNGGFNGAPKFPPTMTLEFLLRYWRRSGKADALEMARDTFVKMARGGIFDQVGGGFARYSVDERWLVPHFEKMLYDNALLIRLGAHLYQATGDTEVRRATEDTIRWASREMFSPEGGFYSSLNADSEGEEGKFYVWSASELDALLGADAAAVRLAYGVSESGNFEGKNILFLPRTLDSSAERLGMPASQLRLVLDRARDTLYSARAKRAWPSRDDKVIASWNGLMVRALSVAARAFRSAEYEALALECAEFLFEEMTYESGGGLRVRRSFNRGTARIDGFLEDHAALGLAALAVYEMTFERRWLDRARALAAACVANFSAQRDAPGGNDDSAPEAAGEFFDTATDHEQLITRPRDVTDNATPSGNSLAAELLLLVSEYFDDGALLERARHLLASLAEGMARYPTAFGHMLCAADTLVHGTTQIALVGEPRSPSFAELRDVLAGVYIPAPLIAGAGPEGDQGIPLLAGKQARGGKSLAYVCRRYTCDAPAGSREELLDRIAADLPLLPTPTRANQ